MLGKILLPSNYGLSPKTRLFGIFVSLILKKVELATLEFFIDSIMD